MPSPPTEDILPYASELLPRSLHFAEEGKVVIVSYLYHGIVCWNVSSKTWQWRIQTGTRIARSALSPDEKAIAICNLMNGFAQYRVKTGEMLSQYPVEVVDNVPLPVLFIHEGRSLLCGSDRGEVTIFNAETGSLVQVLQHPDVVQQAYRRAAGVDWIATGTSEAGDRTSIILWKRRSRKCRNSAVKIN
ncbi:quinon protein alcohol dehydrogenase-like superfamily [Cubamyces menziesii]|nr:quinon protein alcohol dehydrogenase-like superfamily [Cubamyces menziesii]